MNCSDAYPLYIYDSSLLFSVALFSVYGLLG
jgi:hypothetical protein